MSLKIKLIILLILILMIFPMKVDAEDIYSVYYFESDNFGNEYLKSDKYYFNENISVEEKSIILLENLFNNNKIDIRYVPHGTKILDVIFFDGELIININNNIKSYGGGSNYEICMIKQILYTIFEIEDIKKITLLIDGNLDFFPEGSLIYQYTRHDIY